MLDTMGYFLFSNGAIIVWVILCLFGIYYGFLEIVQSERDSKIVHDDPESLRYVVAHGNKKSAYKNIFIQVLFLLVVVLLLYLKITFPGEFTVSFFRSVIIPSLFIFAEGVLVSQLRDLGKVRERIKKMVGDRLRNQGKAEEDIL